MFRLYYADTSLFEKEGVFEQLLERVNEQRRRKVLRCKNEEDKQCALLVGVLLRYALEQHGLEYETIEFDVTLDGKPFLKNISGVYFSLSHSGKRAVCLISDRQIGVDIEWKHRKQLQKGQERRLEAIAKKCFSKDELEEYNEASDVEKVEIFLRNWTRKEAYSKAIGKGLSMDFAKILEEESKFLSFWIDDYYVSMYAESHFAGKELEICMMN